MTFSIYRPIQIFFADHLVYLQKYWHHLQQKILMYHLQRVLLLILCYLLSRKSSQSQKRDEHQKLLHIFFIENHNVKTALRERIV